MITPFLMDYTRDAQGETIGRSIVPSAPGEFVHFLDILREQGWDKARPLFPAKWQWVDQDDEVLPALDLVPIFGSGLVLSQLAFALLKDGFSSMQSMHATFEIDGALYYWIAPPILRCEPNNIDRSLLTPSNPILVLLPGSIKLCSEEFAAAWTKGGLTGCTLQLADLS